MKALFAIPGDLDRPTGGYGYARRVIAAGKELGAELTPLPLPDGFPFADEATIAEAVQRLIGTPAGTPILLDGLAGAVLPAEGITAAAGPVAMLCHHPLALETGTPEADRTRFERLERASLGASAHVVTTSHATANILIGDYGVAHGRISVAPPGTDPGAQATGSAGDAVQILAVGSITPRKGHLRLIEALSAIPNWQLRLVGHSPDPAFAAALRELIARHGLGDRVTFLGALDQEALAEEYANADLFALYSAFEGFGMAFAEAVAHGLPVIGAPSRAVAEATQGAALLVPEAELFPALSRLISDPAERKALAARSIDRAPNLQRWPDTARQIIDVLRKISP